MRVGLDIHGCIDRFPEKFMHLSNNLMLNGHSVHIITGQPWKEVKHKVEEAKISYSHHFSIVDYHRKVKDTKMWQDEKKTFWMDEKVWLRSKGEYCRREKIDVHFDDSYEYAEYMPETTTFILVPKKGLDKFFKLCFNGFSLW